MNWLMRKCKKCSRYVILREKCPYCSGELIVPHPPRYSPVDKYVGYRTKMKLERGLLDLSGKPYYVP
ncbi:MAG: RNA-protein complex protein Nop10 [Desulfurococcaceae archaeon]